MDTSVLQREWKVLLVTGVEWRFWSLCCVFGAESRQERSSCRGEIKCWIIYSCVQTSIKLHCEALWSYSFLQAMLLLSPLKYCEIKQLLSKTANRCRVTGYRRWLLRFFSSTIITVLWNLKNSYFIWFTSSYCRTSTEIYLFDIECLQE